MQSKENKNSITFTGIANEVQYDAVYDAAQLAGSEIEVPAEFCKTKVVIKTNLEKFIKAYWN